MLRQSEPQHEFFQWFSGYYNMSPTVFDLIEKSFLRKCIPFFLIPVDRDSRNPSTISLIFLITLDP